MKRAFGIGIWLIVMLSLWVLGPLIAVGFNVLLRPDYQLRDFGREYQARLPPNRVHWYDYKVFRMDCPDDGSQRVVVLHTTEFDESPREYLTRSYPDCSGIEQQKDDALSGFSGLILGRW